MRPLRLKLKLLNLYLHKPNMKNIMFRTELNALSQEKEAAEASLLEKMDRWEYLEDLAMRISAQ